MHVFMSYMQMVEWYQRAMEEDNPARTATWKPIKWYRKGHTLTGSLEVECTGSVYLLSIVCERVELRDGGDAWWGIWSMYGYPFTPAMEGSVGEETWWQTFKPIFEGPCMWEENLWGGRERVLWPGFGGQGYDAQVEQHVSEVFGHKLSGVSTPLQLYAGVELVVYAHPDVLPAVHVDRRAFSANETERMLGALRRGKDLQELYTRMMSDTASWAVR